MSVTTLTSIAHADPNFNVIDLGNEVTYVQQASSPKDVKSRNYALKLRIDKNAPIPVLEFSIRTLGGYPLDLQRMFNLKFTVLKDVFFRPGEILEFHSADKEFINYVHAQQVDKFRIPLTLGRAIVAKLRSILMQLDHHIYLDGLTLLDILDKADRMQRKAFMESLVASDPQVGIEFRAITDRNQKQGATTSVGSPGVPDCGTTIKIRSAL